MPKVSVVSKSSKLCNLTQTANQALTQFNVSLLVQQAEDFIERLSNWYVRRNRRRFWRPKNESDQDKLAAYQTLYKVLVELCKLLAPVVPFVTDHMYQNLVRTIDSNAPESIHHCEYPQFDQALYNEKLADDMDMIADVVSRTLSIRKAQQIRVRQPLQRLIVIVDDNAKNVLNRYKSHILEELNVKTLDLTDSLDEYLSYTIKPNFKTLGPKFGKDANTVAKLLAEKPARQIALTVAGGKDVTLQTEDNQYQLQPQDILVEKNFAENIIVSDNAEPPLALDIEITEQLHQEGLARDIVRHIQQLRKEIGLEIQDHITVNYHSEDKTINIAVDKHSDYICGETLCNKISTTGNITDAKEVKIASALVSLLVTKAT